MLAEIMNRTPTWVFVLFFALVGLGYLQSRSRQTSRVALWLLPVGMGVFSIYGTGSAFGLSLHAVLAWTAGFGLMFLRGMFQRPSSQASFEPASQRFVIEGSWVPLALMMAIFFTKYAVGVVLARQLPIANNASFVGLASLAYGAFSGVFFARAWRVWRCQPDVRYQMLAIPLDRKSVILTVLALLAMLDLGRSLNAHYGYDEPAEGWRPDAIPPQAHRSRSGHSAIDPDRAWQAGPRPSGLRCGGRREWPASGSAHPVGS